MKDYDDTASRSASGARQDEPTAEARIAALEAENAALRRALARAGLDAASVAERHADELADERAGRAADAAQARAAAADTEARHGREMVLGRADLASSQAANRALWSANSVLTESQAALREAYVEADDARHRAEAGERQRELLLAEFSHRVKNDMQRIVGTMLMQASGSDDNAADALRTAAERVRVIARVHDRLAQRGGHALAHADEYLHDLILDLRSTITHLKPVGLFIEAERHLLSISRAGLVGLVVNELVTNALKYAFPEENREGTVRVGFRRDGEDYLLTVADDGIGLPATSPLVQQEPRKSGGMGRRLVRAIAAQLGGHLEVSETPRTGGTTYTLRFPVRSPGDPTEDA